MKNALKVSMAIRMILDVNHAHVLKLDAISLKAVRLHTVVLVACVNPAMLAISVMNVLMASMAIQNQRKAHAAIANAIHLDRYRVNVIRLLEIVGVKRVLVDSAVINAHHQNRLFKTANARVSSIFFF